MNGCAPNWRRLNSSSAPKKSLHRPSDHTVERPERTVIMQEVIETVGEAVPVTVKLCAALGLPRSTLYRRRQPVAAQPPGVRAAAPFATGTQRTTRESDCP